MTRIICSGYGGYIEVDCFNPQEYEWIAQDQERIKEQKLIERLEYIEKENNQLKRRLEELERNK